MSIKNSLLVVQTFTVIYFRSVEPRFKMSRVRVIMYSFPIISLVISKLFDATIFDKTQATSLSTSGIASKCFQPIIRLLNRFNLNRCSVYSIFSQLDILPISLIATIKQSISFTLTKFTNIGKMFRWSHIASTAKSSAWVKVTKNHINLWSEGRHASIYLSSMWPREERKSIKSGRYSFL